jgi:cardiolipin synthase
LARVQTKTMQRKHQHWYESLRPRPMGGNEISLLASGRQYFPALEQAVAQAQREIFVETYLFEADPTGQRIAQALCVAARRGVQTHLVVDGFGCARFDQGLSQMLRGAGVKMEVFRPEPSGFSLSRQRLRRMHRKIVVVDGEIAFVGGINIIDDQNAPHHGRLTAPRADFAVRVRGPLVARMHLACWRLWWQLGLVNAPRRLARWRGQERRAPALRDLPDPPGPVPPAQGPHRAMLVLRDNVRMRHAIEAAYLRAIGRARREVLIACAYFLPGLRFRRALQAAVQRGVRVRLLLQGREEYALPHWAQRALYDELLRAGIEIIEYQPSFLHAKAAVIDDWATVGSSNIDPFSLLLAREANVVVFDKNFALRLRDAIEELIRSGGQPLLASHHARRSWPTRLLQSIAFSLLRLGVAIAGQGRKSYG